MTIMTPSQAIDVLFQLPPGAKIDLNTLGETNLTQYTSKDELLKARYPHLLTQNITITDAAQKYDVPRATVSSWVYRSKYLQPLDPNAKPIFINEAEIAYLADIYHERRAVKSKAPLLDSDGLPYQIKLPNLAAYRRRKISDN